MAEVFVLGGGTPTPTEFRPRNPRNNRPKFQAEFQVGELFTEPRR